MLVQGAAGIVAGYDVELVPNRLAAATPGKVNRVLLAEVASEVVHGVACIEARCVDLDVVINKGVVVGAATDLNTYPCPRTTKAAAVDLGCVDAALARYAKLHAVVVIRELTVREGVQHGELFNERRAHSRQEGANPVRARVSPIKGASLHAHVVDPVGVEQARYGGVRIRGAGNRVKASEIGCVEGQILHRNVEQLVVRRMVVDLEHGVWNGTTRAREVSARHNGCRALRVTLAGDRVVADEQRVCDLIVALREEDRPAASSAHSVNCRLDGYRVIGRAVASSAVVLHVLWGTGGDVRGRSVDLGAQLVLHNQAVVLVNVERSRRAVVRGVAPEGRDRLGSRER